MVLKESNLKFIYVLSVICLILGCSLLLSDDSYAAVDDSYYGSSWVSQYDDATRLVDLSGSSWTLRNGSTTAWCDVSDYRAGMSNHKYYSKTTIANVSGYFRKPGSSSDVYVNLPVKVITTGYHTSQSSALANVSPVGVYFELGTGVNESSITYTSAMFSYPYGYENESKRYPAQLIYSPNPREHPENYYAATFDDEGNARVTIEFIDDLKQQDQFIVNFIIKNWLWKSGGYVVDSQYDSYDDWLAAYNANPNTTAALLPVSRRGAQGTNVITIQQASVPGNTPTTINGYWLFDYNKFESITEGITADTTYNLKFTAPYLTSWSSGATSAPVNLSQMQFIGIKVKKSLGKYALYYVDALGNEYKMSDSLAWTLSSNSRIIKVSSNTTDVNVLDGFFRSIGQYYGSKDPYDSSVPGGSTDGESGSIINPDSSWLIKAADYVKDLTLYVSNVADAFNSFIKVIFGWLPNELMTIITGLLILTLVVGFLKIIL